MSTFYEQILQKTATVEQKNREKEIRDIRQAIVEAAQNGLYSIGIMRKTLSEEEVHRAFPFFETPVQMHISAMRLLWKHGHWSMVKSNFYEDVVVLTLRAQADRSANVLQLLKENIQTAAERGERSVLLPPRCDFYNEVLASHILPQLQGFTVELSHSRSSIIKVTW